MGQYYYVPDPGEHCGTYSQPVADRLAQLRQQMQQPMIQPAQMQTANQPVQQPAAGSGMIWVGSKLEADNYLVAPGSAVALWDANNPVVYLRQADSTGKPSTKVYELVERTGTVQAQQAPQMDLSNFVTWEKLDEYLSERLKRPSKATQKKEDADNG